jgi:hypothetical protein
MISIHLSDEEITAAAAGERSPRTAHHLQICSECQEQVQMYRDAVAELRGDIVFGAGRSAIDWGRQSRSIQQRIVAAQIEKTQNKNTGFALVSSALALALILTLFVGFRNSSPPALHPTADPISDAALLNDVESRMDEDVPDALQPANLLVDEMGGIQHSSGIRNSSAHARSAQ